MLSGDQWLSSQAERDQGSKESWSCSQLSLHMCPFASRGRRYAHFPESSIGRALDHSRFPATLLLDLRKQSLVCLCGCPWWEGTRG